MNYPFPNSPAYLQAAMAQAVQAMMTGGPLPSNCIVMNLTFPQGQAVFSPMLLGQKPNPTPDSLIYPGSTSIYGPGTRPPYNNIGQTRALMPFPVLNPTTPIFNYQNQNQNQRTNGKTKTKVHPNIYNSSSFDTYMRDLSWSRLFDHPARKNSKSSGQEGNQTNNDEKFNPSKKSRTSSNSSSTSSTTSDETIRRVNVVNQGQTQNGSAKPTTKGTLPFKYSSEFLPGIGKTQTQKGKTNEISNTKKV